MSLTFQCRKYLSIFLSAILLVSVFVLASFSEPQFEKAWAGSFPGVNGKIVFAGTRDSNEIYAMNVDGNGVTRLTNNNATDSYPSWSPDGTKIAYQRSESTAQQIYIMNANGSGETNISNNGALYDSEPSWSPDGKKIVFTSIADNNYQIFVMNADGSNRIRLTDNGANHEATWSPDGTKIAFYSNRDGNLEIYLMNTDGSGETNISNNPAHDLGPSWSPDSTKLSFASNRDGFFQIFAMNTDGSEAARLSKGGEGGYDPSWSPDGTKIVYSNSLSGHTQIFTMNADGTGQTQLTDTFDNLQADWGVQPLVSSVDSDGDGVADDSDLCPDLAGSDANGCPTLQQAIDNLITQVKDMKLPKGIETSLLAPLKNVQKLLDDNNRSNNNAACGKLDAFLNRVEVMEAKDQLSSNQAAGLEAAAGELRDHAPIC